MISFGGKFIQKYLSYSPSIFLKVGYEIRSTSVHEQMLNMWKQNFDLKIVPSSKVHIPFHLLAIYWLSNLCSQINVIQLLRVFKKQQVFCTFWLLFSDNFHSLQMDDTYQHPSIQLFIMGLKPQAETTEKTSKEIAQTTDEVETNQDMDQNVGGSNESEQDAEVVEKVKEDDAEVVEKEKEDGDTVTTLTNAKLSDWDARRCGSIAARLLQDVKITNS